MSSFLVGVIRLFLFLWDLLTYPVYVILQIPWMKQRKQSKILAKPVSTQATEVTYRSVAKETKVNKELKVGTVLFTPYTTEHSMTLIYQHVESFQNVQNWPGGAGGYNGQIIPVLCQEIWWQELYGDEGCAGRRTRETTKWKGSNCPNSNELEKGSLARNIQIYLRLC